MPDNSRIFSANSRMGGGTNDGTALPALTNGSKEAGPGLVSHPTGHPLNVLWDGLLPLVLAIAVPLLLKRALESKRLMALLRFPSVKERSPEAAEDPSFDFD